MSELRSHQPFALARRFKRHVARKLKQFADPKETVVSLKPAEDSKGYVLLSYILDPFLLKPGEPVSHAHTNRWESFQIARTFVDLGYSVDVIDFLNETFYPTKQYSVFVDTRCNFERLAASLNSDCLKIMHIDTSHALFKAAAESRRLLELQQRKGATLVARRFEWPNLAIEHADCATVLGNEFTLGTFRYAKKPLYRVPLSNPFVYPWPDGKDFEACRKRYLWFGDRGMVHKGLDLALEAFAEMPAYHLTVCGPVAKEQDFERAYYKELYETANIETIGWVDVASPKFLEITRRCIGLIYPSCSEGQAGAVITCLHAGLIPVISYESGVDIHDFGIVLHTCSIAEIQNSVRQLSGLLAKQLEQMARKAWHFARANHTRETFAREYRNAVEKILRRDAVSPPLE
jgi:glycosyltransferase involved in cell wall biosynthesis